MRAFLKLIFLVGSMFLIIGCTETTDASNTGGGNFNPTITISNADVEYSNGFINQYKGDLKIVENNLFYTTVNFSNITPSLDSGSECNITNFSISKTTLKSGESASFTITTNNECANINTLILQTLEAANYVDTTNKTIQSTITFEKDINISKTVTSDEDVGVSSLVVSPSSFKVVDGLQKEITVITLDQNSNPVPSSKVKISVPVDANGDVFGSFDSYELTTGDNGQATVTYTAPDDIDSFEGNESVAFSVVDTSISKSVTLIFSQDVTDENETVAVDYEITMSVPNSIEVDNSGNIIVNIVESKNSENEILDNNVHEVNVTSLVNGFISFKGDGSEAYEYNSTASKSITVYSAKTSGIDILRVSAYIFDGEKNVTITKDFPLTISSGPISSMSIVYSKTTYDGVFFNDEYTVHAVDKFGNPANAGSKIYMGVVNGLRVDKDDDELFVEKNGTIDYDSSNDITEFNLTNTDSDFSNVEEGDNVVILAEANRLDSKYLGGWVIGTKVDDKTLNFESKYFGDTTEKLTFVVGNENRYDGCEKTVKVADFDSADKTYTTDDNGNAKLTLRYDPYLIGKDVYIYANSYSDKRVGTALRKKLWGTGIPVPASLTCTAPDSGSKTCTFDFVLTPSDSPKVLQDVRIGGFKLSGECTVKSTDLLTECDGVVSITVDTPAKKSCTVQWNGSIQYEH
jgi:hypothetical protein